MYQGIKKFKNDFGHPISYAQYKQVEQAEKEKAANNENNNEENNEEKKNATQTESFPDEISVNAANVPD